MIRIFRTAFFCLIIGYYFLAGCKKVTQDASGIKNENPVSTTTSTDKDSIPAQVGYKTKNVIIVMVDGARYSETFGDSTHQYIPNLSNLSAQGVLLSSFSNMGVTLTDPGHCAIVNGNYENIENSGKQLPQYPSIFQMWLKATGEDANKAWVVASKDKLQILGNCLESGWAGNYMPRTDCGVNGLGTGYRSDDTTFVHAKNVLAKYHPNLMLINFKDADVYGHANQWNKYLMAIKASDAYIKSLYDLIQADNIYKDKTTIIITNDHGRHLNGVADNFVSHGDNCAGCRHIEFLAIGPDLKRNVSLQTPYDQIDISKTVAKLMNFKMDYSKGKVMTDIFK